jgi:hypothetical protein
MDELNAITEKKELENEDLEIVELDLPLQETSDTAETIETVEVVEVQEEIPVVIAIEESVGWVGGDHTRHYSLAGRDESDQHPITAITGLRTELNKIEALQPVYSNQTGVANYYKWYEGAYDEAGYFVSLVPKTSAIKICDGADIFGVTVDQAGFIGNQDGVTLDYVNGTVNSYGATRNNTYALVVTSGLVDVRCELSVNVGDYVISNAYGIAEKTESGCGYKVIAINTKFGETYASIALGVQACTTDALGKELQRMNDDIENAEINIAAAIHTANAAYDKAVSSNTISDEALLKALEAIEKSDEAIDATDRTNTQLESVSTTTAQARAIAESAVTSAISIKDEAVTKANDAWAKAEKVETEVYSLCAQIDQYSVGEYSQAYGLTIEQARAILKTGMIYIPTKHGDAGTHAETYEGFGTVEFTNGFYYEWNGLYWSEKLGEVWFGTEQPAGTTYTYWYDGTRLFLLQDGEWSEVATLAGNVNNRITSMIRQDVDEVRAEVVNARGSAASLGVRITDTESDVQSLALWSKGGDENGTQYNLATIKQTADDAGASIAQVVESVGENGEVSASSIVQAINNDESSVVIEADRINLDGYVTVTNLSTNGQTVINGGNITTGKITVKDTDNDLLFSAGDNQVYLAGWNVDENSLYHGNSFKNSDMFICTGSGTSFDIGDSGSINGWMIKAGSNFGVTTSGALYCSDAHIAGEITATSGYIGNDETGWKISTMGIMCFRSSTLNTADTISTGFLQTDTYKLPSLRTGYMDESAIRIYAGCEEQHGVFTSPTFAPFAVLEDGSVYCSALASIGYNDDDEITNSIKLSDGMIYIEHPVQADTTTAIVPLVKFKYDGGWFEVCARRTLAANTWTLVVQGGSDGSETV